MCIRDRGRDMFNVSISKYWLYKEKQKGPVLPCEFINSIKTVSYTHLDVYKRQEYGHRSVVYEVLTSLN